MEWLSELRERRLAQFLITYCAGGWIVLEAIAQVVDRAVLPEVAYRVVLTLFLCGIPGALIVSWYHGARGRQTVPLTERWLLGGVGIVALMASGFVARANLAPEGMLTGMAALQPWENPSRVAVLYFDSRGGGEDGEFLAAGLTEGLIDELSTVEALHVVSRNGSEMFRDSDVSPDSIGRTLGAGTIVDGNVAVAGDRLRVEVFLVEASSGRQVASRKLDHARADLFELQDTLAHEVGLFLRERIGEEVGQIESRSATTVQTAWELYQQAQEVARDADGMVDHDDLDGASRQLARADSLMARAEAEDPTWLDPVTQRGWMAYSQSRLGGMDRMHYERWIEVGLEHAERALQRAPNDPDALELRGTLLYWKYLLNLGDDHGESHDLMERAEKDFRASALANPRQASALTSLTHLLMAKGQLTEAKLKAVQSYESDPFLRNADLTLWRLFQTSWDMDDAVEARRWCEEGARRFPDSYRFAQCQVMNLALEGQEPDIADGWVHQRRWVELAPPQVREINEKKSLVYMAMALARAELADSARAVALRSRAGPDIDPLREVAFFEVIVRTWLGDEDEAARILGQFLAANPDQLEAYRHVAGTGDVAWYHAELLDNDRFRELVGAR